MSSNGEIWFSALELGRLGAAKVIPDMPRTDVNARKAAKRLGWPQRSVECMGGKHGMRTEYQPPADILALIQAFLQAHPDFFKPVKAHTRAGQQSPGHTRVEQLAAPYTVSPGTGDLFDRQSVWSEAIVRVALFVRNKPLLANAPPDLHQRVALLVYRFVFLYCDGDLQRVARLLDDAGKLDGLVRMAYEADCMKRGVAPGSDLNPISSTK